MNLLAFYSLILLCILVLILVFLGICLFLLCYGCLVLILSLLVVLLLCLGLLGFLYHSHHDLVFLHLLQCVFLLVLSFSFLLLCLFLHSPSRIVVCRIVIFDKILVGLDRNSFFCHFCCLLIFHSLLQVLLLLHILLLFHLVLVRLLALPYILDNNVYLVLLQILLDMSRIFLFLLIILRVLLVLLLFRSLLLPLVITSFECRFVVFSKFYLFLIFICYV